MSPASRWHHRCCRPNVVLAGQMPFCKSCTEIHGSQELLDLRLPDRPAIPVYDELQLSWPSAIVPALRKDDTLGKNDTRVPTTNSRGQLDTTADSSLPNTPPPTIRCPFYDYDDLRFRDVIRVLELSRGAPGDPLHGQLTTFLIRDDAKYEALSYTWGNYDSLDPGDADCSRPCLIYLGDFWDPFPITSNCYYALRRLRSRGQPRRLWVDSICINQWNVEERGHQVDLMDGVFAKASSVIVYLGNESPDSSLALALLQQPERMDDVTEDEKSSLDSLFRRPYFSRMWIVQEVALAKSLHFYCGPSEAIFSPENWVRCPIINPWKNKSAAPWLKYSMQSFREIRDRVSILNFLEDTGNCQCSDPRDRIFALFGLINIPHSPKLDANYSLSTEQVFTGIAAFAGLVDQESFRRIAKLASRSQHSQSLPSWVPDWADGAIYDDRTHQTQHASQRPGTRLPVNVGPNLYTRSKPQATRNGRLVIRGYILSKDWPDMDFELTERGVILRPGPQHEGPQLLLNFGITSTRASAAAQTCDGVSLLMLPQWLEHDLLTPRWHTPTWLLLGTNSRNRSQTFSLIGAGEPSIEVFKHNSTWTSAMKSFNFAPFYPREETSIGNLVSEAREFPRLLNIVNRQRAADRPFGGCIFPQMIGRRWKELRSKVKLWAHWQECEVEGLRILQDPSTLNSALHHLRVMEEKRNQESLEAVWHDFYNDVEGSSGVILRVATETRPSKCLFATFLSLFISDPRITTTSSSALDVPEQPRGGARKAEGVSGLTPLNALREWARVTLMLLPGLRTRLGHLISLRAAETWSCHKAIADALFGVEPKWFGWDAQFVMKKIRRRRVGALNVEEKAEGLHNLKPEDAGYFDWNEFKLAVEDELENLRSSILAEGLHQERDSAEEQLLDKIATHMILDDMGFVIPHLAEEEITIV